MPYIKRLPTKPKNRNNRKRNKTEKGKLRQRLYNMSEWKKLRLAYIMQHPLCERCLSNGIVNGNNIQCHHKQSPFDEGLTENERLERLLDPNNIESICPQCHGKEHFNQQKKK